MLIDFEFIKIVMAKRNLTEEQLAEKMELSADKLHYYMYEWEQKDIPLELLFSFSQALEVPFELLILKPDQK